MPMERSYGGKEEEAAALSLLLPPIFYRYWFSTVPEAATEWAIRVWKPEKRAPPFVGFVKRVWRVAGNDQSA